jgi:hypothetical protein
MELLSARNKFYLSPLVCINLKHPSFIIGNADVDFRSAHLPTSPPITPVWNVGPASGGTEMTVPCEIPLHLFVRKLILTFINSNLTADQVQGSVQDVVDFLQQSSSILAGSSLLKSLCSIPDKSVQIPQI